MPYKLDIIHLEEMDMQVENSKLQLSLNFKNQTEVIQPLVLIKSITFLYSQQDNHYNIGLIPDSLLLNINQQKDSIIPIESNNNKILYYEIILDTSFFRPGFYSLKADYFYENKIKKRRQYAGSNSIYFKVR
jgi:hypothetical protein